MLHSQDWTMLRWTSSRASYSHSWSRSSRTTPVCQHYILPLSRFSSRYRLCLVAPKWLNCTRQMTPDFVAKDPKKTPVFEITGAEFSRAELHTADGISIRFPRITKRRDDKTWKTATSLEELKALFKVSKESTDYDIDYSTKGE